MSQLPLKVVLVQYTLTLHCTGELVSDVIGISPKEFLEAAGTWENANIVSRAIEYTTTCLHNVTEDVERHLEAIA